MLDNIKQRIIIINDLYVAGGTEVQSQRELANFTNNGHEALYITFDSKLKYHESKMKNHINLAKKSNLLNRYICNIKIYKELKKIIEDFKPDFIHLNNTYLYAPTVYKAVKKYYCIQTLRDYAYVCPKSTCVMKDCSICNGMKYKNCIKECLSYKPKEFVKFFAKYIALKHNKEMQLKSVNQFLSPSQKLTDYCNDHGYNTICLNNPFDFNIINNFEKKEENNKKIYLYYGMVARIKGIMQLIEAFKKFSKEKEDVELHIVGRLKELTIQDLDCDNKIKYFKPLSYDKIMEKLQSVYSVVVPSLWMENYPNTVLEGFATKCIVLGSNRGGMIEQINDNNRIFDVMNIDNVIQVLNYSYNLSEKEKKNIYEKQQKYLEEHNTLEDYYNKILLIVQKGKEKNEKNNF